MEFIIKVVMVDLIKTDLEINKNWYSNLLN